MVKVTKISSLFGSKGRKTSGIVALETFLLYDYEVFMNIFDFDYCTHC